MAPCLIFDSTSLPSTTLILVAALILATCTIEKLPDEVSQSTRGLALHIGQVNVRWLIGRYLRSLWARHRLLRLLANSAADSFQIRVPFTARLTRA